MFYCPDVNLFSFLLLKKCTCSLVDFIKWLHSQIEWQCHWTRSLEISWFEIITNQSWEYRIVCSELAHTNAELVCVCWDETGGCVYIHIQYIYLSEPVYRWSFYVPLKELCQQTIYWLRICVSRIPHPYFSICILMNSNFCVIYLLNGIYWISLIADVIYLDVCLLCVLYNVHINYICTSLSFYIP